MPEQLLQLTAVHLKKPECLASQCVTSVFALPLCQSLFHSDWIGVTLPRQRPSSTYRFGVEVAQYSIMPLSSRSSWRNCWRFSDLPRFFCSGRYLPESIMSELFPQMSKMESKFKPTRTSSSSVMLSSGYLIIIQFQKRSTVVSRQHLAVIFGLTPRVLENGFNGFTVYKNSLMVLVQLSLELCLLTYVNWFIPSPLALAGLPLLFRGSAKTFKYTINMNRNCIQ